MRLDTESISLVFEVKRDYSQPLSEGFDLPLRKKRECPFFQRDQIMISQTHSKLVVLAVSALAVSFAVHAGDKQERSHDGMKPSHMEFPIDLQEVEKQVQEQFDQFDANGDGTISLEELQVDSPEIKRHMRKLAAAARGRNVRERRQQAHEVEFETLDQDGDGTISNEEYENRDLIMRQERMERLFAALDTDEDGAITINEFPGRHTFLQTLDKDGDGTVSKTEMAAAKKHRKGKRKRGHHGQKHENGDVPSR